MYSSIYLEGDKKTVSMPSTTISENESLDSFIRKKAQFYFFKMANRELNEQQMKIQFSKDILTVWLTSIPACTVAQTNIKQMEQHLQENMTFLKTLYPQPKTSIMNRQIFQGLVDFDHTDRVDFDLMANLGFSYEITNKDSTRTDILAQTQTLFNNLIKSSENTLNQFTNILLTLIPKKLSSTAKTNYQNLMKQPWKFDLDSDITKTYMYNKDLVGEKLFFPSIQLFRVASQWVSHLEHIIEDPEKYVDQTQYLKMVSNGKVGNLRLKNQRNNKIFNKFPVQNQNKKSFSQQTNPQTDASHNPEDQPSIFMKFYNKIKQMCQGESQQTTFQNMDQKYHYETFSQSSIVNSYTEPCIQNTEKYGNYLFKQAGYLKNHYVESLQEINSEVQYRKFCEEQLEFLRKGYIQTVKIVDKNKLKQKYTMEQKKVYSFCQNSYFFMQEIVIERLIKLIQTFLRLKQKSENEYQKSMVYQDVDMIRFNQQNVISAFIVGDQKLLIQIHKAILQLAEQRQVKIAKVENRFGTSSNDALIILKIKNNPILCQLRLVLQPQNLGPESKQKALGDMHKFLDEIEKAQYGPISHLAMILAMKDNRVSYLQSIKMQPLENNKKLAQVCHCGKGSISQKSSINTFEKQIKNIITQQGYIKLDCYRNLIPSSFVCGVCQKVVKKGECIIPVPSCFECGFHICVECSFSNNASAQKSIYAMLINSIAKIVDPSYFSELELSNHTKMNYNHTYTKDVQMLINGRAQTKKQTHYHIVLEEENFVRFGKLSNSEQFWSEVEQKIDLRNIQQYKTAIKQQKFAGILFRPRQLLCQKGVPFIFLTFNAESRQFSKMTFRGTQDSASQTPINTNQVNVSQNDIFVPILWIFGESLVTDYITKVLQTNPFCVKKLSMKDSSIDNMMRFSRSKIRSHHIMR